MIERVTFRNFAVVFVAVLSLFFLGGCANPYQPIVNSAQGATLAVDTGNTLLVAKTISVADAKPIYVAGVAVEGALKTWQTAVDTPGTSKVALTADETAVTNALNGLSNALGNVYAKLLKEGKIKVGVPPKLPASAKSLSPTELQDILQLVEELAPEFVNFVDGLFNGSSATDADVTAAISGLDTANVALLARINGQ